MAEKNAIIIFLDGVGLGDEDPEANPFMHVEMQSLQALLGVAHPTRRVNGAASARAVLFGTDAQLGVEGLPQSATGQTTILTGLNSAEVLGHHYGPYPNSSLRQMLGDHSIFKTLTEAGQPVAYANAYPDRFLERVRRGKGRMSANTHAAVLAGLKLRSRQDLQAGQALPALLTNSYWPEADANLPPLTEFQAGVQLVNLAQHHTLVFFEFWYSDMVGHRMEREPALDVVHRLDRFFSGVFSSLNWEQTLLLIVSDHGNFEDLSTKRHTANPSFTLAAGSQAHAVAANIHSLVDITPTVLDYLG